MIISHFVRGVSEQGDMQKDGVGSVVNINSFQKTNGTNKISPENSEKFEKS